MTKSATRSTAVFGSNPLAPCIAADSSEKAMKLLIHPPNATVASPASQPPYQELYITAARNSTKGVDTTCVEEDWGGSSR